MNVQSSLIPWKTGVAKWFFTSFKYFTFCLAQKYLKIRVSSRMFSGRIWGKWRNATVCWGRLIPKMPFNTHCLAEILKISPQCWLIYFVLNHLFWNLNLSLTHEFLYESKSFCLSWKLSEQKYPTKRPLFLAPILELLKESFKLLGCWWLMEGISLRLNSN